MTYRKFKEWLYAEAKLDPSATQPYKVDNGNTKRLRRSFALTLDDRGNVVSYDYTQNKPHLEISPNSKSISLQKLSPQSAEFHKIVNALRSKYPDIDNWRTDHFFMAGLMQGAGTRSRTAGYWMKNPPVQLANKMPPYFFHGTSTNLWYDGIKQKGLMPRRLTGSSGTYGAQNISSLSQADLVYLSTDPDAAAREASGQAAAKHGGSPLILRISSNGLDASRLVPDEDTRTDSAQASINIGSILAYSGRIPPSSIEPFLLGTKKKKNNRLYTDWEKFTDVEVTEHPVTTSLRKGEVPWSSSPEYYALKDAGIIGVEETRDSNGHTDRRTVIKDTEFDDQKIRSILKSSGWTNNARAILNDVGAGYSGTIYLLQTFTAPQELLEDQTIKMLIESGIITPRNHENNVHFEVRGWNSEKYAIALAKLMGRMSFQELSSRIKEIVDTYRTPQ